MNLKKNRIVKKATVMVMCAAMAISCFGISASAANTSTAKSWTLYKSQTYSTSGNTSVTKRKGRITKLCNSGSSNDGVNLYLYYAVPGYAWQEAQHSFAEKGTTVSENSYYKAWSNAIWYGKMCSWWWNGKNCSATGAFDTK